MKRVYLILTLFMTSFFLLSSNVRASTKNFNVNSTDFDRINNTFFKVRELAIDLAIQKNKYYLIIQNNYNEIQYYQVLLFYNTKIENSGSSFNLLIWNGLERYIYKNEILEETTAITTYDYSLSFASLSKTDIYYYNYLDTSYDNLTYKSFSYDFIINYENDSRFITYDTRVPSLYELYMEYFISEEEIDPKAEIVTNFYVLVIDKIKLLTNYIATDYIILSALVIFIFVAVIGLVRRLK